MYDGNLVYLHAVYTRVCSYVKREDDLQIGKNIYIKRQSLSRRQERSHFFSSPLAANLASFISISLLPTRLLKLQHVLGLFHFISNGLAFSVTEEKRISEKINPLKMGFHQGYSVWCCVKFKNKGTQWH